MVFALLFPLHLAGQQASLYVPVDDDLMPYVEHLIRAGVMRDPDPLTRPLHRGEQQAVRLLGPFVGDQVLRSTKNLILKHAERSRKLTPRWVGPFTVVQKVGSLAYKL